MEYVPGKTLDEIIPHKDMRLGDVLNYAVQIADALSRPQTAGVGLKYWVLKTQSSIYSQFIVAAETGRYAAGTRRSIDENRQ